MPARPKRLLARSVFVADIGATLWWLLSLDFVGAPPSPAAWYRYGLILVVFLAFLLAFAPHAAVVGAATFAAMLGRFAEFAGMTALLCCALAWLAHWPPASVLPALGGAFGSMLAIHALARFGCWLFERIGEGSGRQYPISYQDPFVGAGAASGESWSRMVHLHQPMALLSPIAADSSQPTLTYAAQRARPAPRGPVGGWRFQALSELAVAALPESGRLANDQPLTLVVTRDMRFSALTTAQRLTKRIFDVVVCTVALVALAPALLVIGLLVKLDSPGPALFRQQRLGKHGALFPMIKFRSMCVDAEQRWREVSQRDEQGRLIHKTSSDPRVTSLGRLLRRTSLDEIPQLLNVLRGEMSLVGPRPEMPYMLGEYEPWQLERFEVTPGITGWWQINGRGDRLMHLHTEDDIYYIRHYSFFLDIKILWKTIGVVARSDGAF